MRIIVLYRPNSEHARLTEEYFHEFQKRTPHPVEMLNIDTREGAHEADLYDVVAYPAVIVVGNEGQVMKSWEGEELPLMDELAAYARA